MTDLLEQLDVTAKGGAPSQRSTPREAKGIFGRK